MASYAYTANSATAATSANIATSKISIATSNVAIQYTTSFPNVALTGNITVKTEQTNQYPRSLNFGMIITYNQNYITLYSSYLHYCLLSR